MKHALKAMVIAAALGAGSLLVASPASAHEHGSRSSIYVDVGNVAVAYRNGYHDHHRRWRQWRSHDEWRHFRRHHRSHYRDYAYRHDRHDRYDRHDRRHRRGYSHRG